MVVTKEFLNQRNVPDIGSIRIYPEDCINKSNNLTQEQIEHILFPEVIPPLQQEFKSWHDKLSNLHPKSMFILAKPGVLPSIFLDLKYDVPLCESCIFGTSRRRQWIKKGINKGP